MVLGSRICRTPFFQFKLSSDQRASSHLSNPKARDWTRLGNIVQSLTGKIHLSSLPKPRVDERSNLRRRKRVSGLLGEPPIASKRICCAPLTQVLYSCYPISSSTVRHFSDFSLAGLCQQDLLCTLQCLRDFKYLAIVFVLAMNSQDRL